MNKILLQTNTDVVTAQIVSKETKQPVELLNSAWYGTLQNLGNCLAYFNKVPNLREQLKESRGSNLVIEIPQQHNTAQPQRN